MWDKRALILFVITCVSLASVTCADKAQTTAARRNQITHNLSHRLEASRTREKMFRLYASEVIGDSTAFGRISFILDTGQFLLVGDQLTSPHLAIVDKHGEVLWRIGKHGNGPGEMIDPFWAHQDFADKEAIIVYDYKTAIFFRIKLQDDGAPVILDQWRVPQLLDLQQPIVTQRNVISNGYFADQTIIKFDRLKDVVTAVSVEPPAFSYRGIPPAEAKFKLNRNRAAVSPDGRRFVLAYQSANRFDLFIDGSYTNSWKGPREIAVRFTADPDERRIRWMPKNEYAYVAVVASRKYVYGLFCGPCASAKTLPRTVHVFYWSGQYVRTIELDHGTTRMAVSEDDAVLYGAIEEPFPAIAIWRIPQTVS